jgi:hypothetical protein
MVVEGPLLVPTAGSPTVVWKGVTLYPPEDPIEYARRKARVFSAPPRTLVFVPSVGLGYGLADLLDRLDAESAILCVEIHQELMALANAAGLPRDPRLCVVRTDDPSAVTAALRNLGAHRFRRVVQLPLCAGYRLDRERYESYRVLLQEQIRRHWQNRLTLIALGSLQVRNLLANIGGLADAADFSALAADAPLVVVGAGPSLDASLPVIARVRGRILLAAVDTALPSLAASGLVPDLVVALEAQAANLQDFIPMPDRRILLVCDLSSHPSTARLFPGRCFYFCSGFAELHIFDRMSSAGLMPFRFPALGSVGVAAAHAALCITRGDIFLTGLDFSFSHARTHSRCAPHHLAMLRSSTRVRPVGAEAFAALASQALVRLPDKRGGTVPASRLMCSYRDSLAATVAAHPADAARVADLGREGLPLGIHSVSEEEFEARVAGRNAPRPVLEIDARLRWSRAAVSDFLRAEQDILQRTADAARESLASGISEQCLALLRAADHAWVHFPDAADVSAPDRGLLLRAGIAAAYYAERVARIRSVL